MVESIEHKLATILMQVVLAGDEYLSEIAELFDLYRIFYQQSSDIEAARKFIQTRLHQQDSRIFVAIDRQHAFGFTQLYPSFSSVRMQPNLDFKRFICGRIASKSRSR